MIHLEAITREGMKLKDLPETSRVAFIHNIPGALPNVGFRGGKFYTLTYEGGVQDPWTATWNEEPFGKGIYYNDQTGHVFIADVPEQELV